jgi:hypothetical protein
MQQLPARIADVLNNELPSRFIALRQGIATGRTTAAAEFTFRHSYMLERSIRKREEV